MSLLTTDVHGRKMLAQEQVADLLVRPLEEQSLAAQVATVDTLTGEGLHSILYPLWSNDPAVSWVAEGEEIPQGTPELDEIEVVPSKVAGLFVCSSELLHDSNPQASQEVGRGLVRQVVNSVDAAFFGPRPSSNAPAGLESLAGVTEIDGAADNVDWAEEALAASPVDTFITHPSDALNIAKIKESTGSLRGLLQSDPAQKSGRTLAGIPLLTSKHVSPGTVWAIPRDMAKFVLREDASVIADNSAFFTSDRVALRATMRVGFGFTAPDQIIKVLLDDPVDDGQ